jgi:hypothetical protein
MGVAYHGRHRRPLPVTDIRVFLTTEERNVVRGPPVGYHKTRDIVLPTNVRLELGVYHVRKQ